MKKIFILNLFLLASISQADFEDDYRNAKNERDVQIKELNRVNNLFKKNMAPLSSANSLISYLTDIAFTSVDAILDSRKHCPLKAKTEKEAKECDKYQMKMMLKIDQLVEIETLLKGEEIKCNKSDWDEYFLLNNIKVDGVRQSCEQVKNLSFAKGLKDSGIEKENFLKVLTELKEQLKKSENRVRYSSIMSYVSGFADTYAKAKMKSQKRLEQHQKCLDDVRDAYSKITKHAMNYFDALDSYNPYLLEVSKDEGLEIFKSSQKVTVSCSEYRADSLKKKFDRRLERLKNEHPRNRVTVIKRLCKKFSESKDEVLKKVCSAGMASDSALYYIDQKIIKGTK